MLIAVITGGFAFSIFAVCIGIQQLRIEVLAGIFGLRKIDGNVSGTVCATYFYHAQRHLLGHHCVRNAWCDDAYKNRHNREKRNKALFHAVLILIKAHEARLYS